MEELLRRVDLDGGDINLDDLLRQAAGAESDHSEDGGNAASGAPQGSADGAAGDREARPTAGTGAAAGGGIDDDMPPARTPNAPQRDTPMRPGAGGGGAATARGGGMEATRSPGSEPTDESADDALRFAEWKAAAGAPDPFAGMGVGSDSGGDYDDDEDDNGDGDVDDDSDEDDEGSFSDQDWKGALAFRLDRSTLTFARRWGNVVNGVLLALTGPLALIFSASQLAIGKAVLALHVTCARANACAAPCVRHGLCLAAPLLACARPLLCGLDVGLICVPVPATCCCRAGRSGCCSAYMSCACRRTPPGCVRTRVF